MGWIRKMKNHKYFGPVISFVTGAATMGLFGDEAKAISIVLFGV